jgi:antimicrobial peptide system SdpA family protein
VKNQERPADARDHRRWLGLVALGLLASWSTLGVHAVHSAIPNNPVRLPLKEQLQTQLWLPQGWKFFTRSAREETTSPYLRGEDGRWRSASTAPNFQARNLFGASRDGRAQGVEIGLILRDASHATREACRATPEICLDRARSTATLHTPSPSPTLCGDVGFVFRKPVPWAWSRSKVQMPSEVLWIKVVC